MATEDEDGEPGEGQDRLSGEVGLRTPEAMFIVIGEDLLSQVCDNQFVFFVIASIA